ncbi:MAG: DUF3500 domain-containing protein, partial [Chloroflexi bacterium]|nr:DUF3500 domain-containing protein [Chloroflexota bacterium]
MAIASPHSEFVPRQRPPMSARHPFTMSGGMPNMFESFKKGVTEPFVGVTTSGQPEHGLFSIQDIGISTAPIRAAAERFLGELSAEQRAHTCFDLDAPEFRVWSNIHPYLWRHGVMLEDLTDSQRNAALGLLQASLSSAGYSLARDIMRLNEFIGDICNGKWEEYGEWLYWISIFGQPSDTEPWAWQIDGHHLNLNCFVLGSQVVMTPMFMGSEPNHGTYGKWNGVRVFGDEESCGQALWEALSASQQEAATMEHPAMGQAAAGRDNAVFPYVGVRYTDMTPAQRDLLVELVSIYTGRLAHGHGRMKADEVRCHFTDTYFGFVDRRDADHTFYYRVHSPVILIEFDHQAGVALADEKPTRN